MYVPVNAGFPFDWEYMRDVQRYYRPVFELTSWSTAHSRCRQFGSRSRLVDINNAAESEALKLFIDSFDGKSMNRNQNKIIIINTVTPYLLLNVTGAQALNNKNKKRNRAYYCICRPICKQESAAYATVSARQSRHLANTFEVAAIEGLTWVAT